MQRFANSDFHGIVAVTFPHNEVKEIREYGKRSRMISFAQKSHDPLGVHAVGGVAYESETSRQGCRALHVREDDNDSSPWMG